MRQQAHNHCFKNPVQQSINSEFLVVHIVQMTGKDISTQRLLKQYLTFNKLHILLEVLVISVHIPGKQIDEAPDENRDKYLQQVVVTTTDGLGGGQLLYLEVFRVMEHVK